MVLLVFIDKENRILIGECANGHNPCFGMLIEPGGKREEGESSVDAALREGPQETNLTPDTSAMSSAGQLTVRFTTGKIFRIEVFTVRNWFGILRASSSPEFKSLNFLGVNEIPWEKAPEGDEQMIRDILDGYKLDYTIWCGDSRKNVLCIKPTRYKPK